MTSYRQQQIYDVMRKWERENPFPARPTIPAGTPNRRALQHAADAEFLRSAAVTAWHDARAIALARITHELRSASARERATTPEATERRHIFAELRRRGFVRETVSGRSAYYRNGPMRVRVSDHDVPTTPEREYSRENGGTTWADSGASFVIGRDDAAEWLAWIDERMVCHA